MATSIMGNWYSSTATIMHVHGYQGLPVTSRLNIPTKHAACLKPTWNDCCSPGGKYNQLWDGIYMATFIMGNWFCSTATIMHVYYN